MESNHIQRIALVGAGGRSGTHITDHLLSSSRNFTLTALTRSESSNTLPEGIQHIQQIDYDNHASLVSALQNQQVLIITLNVFAPASSQKQLVDAAVEAGVQWIIPNEWGIDLSREGVGKDTGMGERLWEMRRYIESRGGKWIGVACSFWYEFSLAGSAARYGFDFPNKHLTLFDSGETRINTTTFDQVGRGVTSLLSLPIQPTPTSSSSQAYLTDFTNNTVYISSFHLSQGDMLASVLRVTGDGESDWTITQEPSAERFAAAKRRFERDGEGAALVTMLYTRVFYPDGSGSFEEKLHNSLLGLPIEDLDSATRRAVGMAGREETNMPEGKRERTV